MNKLNIEDDDKNKDIDYLIQCDFDLSIFNRRDLGCIFNYFVFVFPVYLCKCLHRFFLVFSFIIFYFDAHSLYYSLCEYKKR